MAPQNVDGKHVQIQLTGFMEKNTGRFMKELWGLLISAQSNLSGIPQQFLDIKAEETRLKKVNLLLISPLSLLKLLSCLLNSKYCSHSVMPARMSQCKDHRSITIHFMLVGHFWPALSHEELGNGNCIDCLSTHFQMFHLVHVMRNIL